MEGDPVKIQFFRSTVESVLLYEAESWTIKNAMCRRLDVNYTRMLRAVVGFTWRDRKTNNELYGELSKVTSVLKVIRLNSLGTCDGENKSWYDRCSCGNQSRKQEKEEGRQ